MRCKKPIDCPRGMLWFSVSLPTESQALFSVKSGKVVHKLKAGTAPAFFNPTDITSYWPTAHGTTLLVRRDLLCIHHPVPWKDEEIASAVTQIIEFGVVPCAVGPRGERLVDITCVSGHIHIPVLETVDTVAARISQSKPHHEAPNE